VKLRRGITLETIKLLQMLLAILCSLLISGL
jgi:hypothetical protein